MKRLLSVCPSCGGPRAYASDLGRQCYDCGFVWEADDDRELVTDDDERTNEWSDDTGSA